MPNPYTSPRRVELADGAQIAATTTETIIWPDIAFDADDPFIYPGAGISLVGWFDISNVVTTPGTVRFRVRWGGVGGVVLADSGAIPMDVTARANYSGRIEADVMIRSIGATGKAFCQGLVQLGNVPVGAAARPQGAYFMGNAGENVPGEATIDTTVAKLLSMSAEFSVATAGTQLRGHLRRALLVSS